MAQMQMRNRDIYSNELANGDRSDDKEVEDENDVRDSIVNDNGFVNQWKNHSSGGSMWATRAQMAAQDDWNSDVGTYASQKTRNYATPYRTSENLKPFWAENHIMDGTHIQTPRVDGPQPMRNSPDYVQMGDLYSNEVANGDKSDDKELESEEDPYDAIVDH